MTTLSILPIPGGAVVRVTGMGGWVCFEIDAGELDNLARQIEATRRAGVCDTLGELVARVG